MHTQYYILNKKTPNLYFPECKLAIEIDEYVHVDKDFKYEKERQIMLEKSLAVYLLELILMLQILTLIE